MTVMDMIPCPFCGSSDLRVHVYRGEEPEAFVQCHNCATCGPSGTDKDHAIERWNTRLMTAIQSQAEYRVASMGKNLSSEYLSSVIVSSPSATDEQNSSMQKQPEKPHRE